MTVQSAIQSQLTLAFSPDFLDVHNESHGHNVAPGSETHFKVVLVSSVFDQVSQVQRHRKVYAELASFMNSGVHALALHTYTPTEWMAVGQTPESPACMGKK